MSGGLLLSLYAGATRALTPLAPALIAWRRRQGKEDRARSGERRGFTQAPRPSGPLVWLHGASVGEGLALLPLIVRLRERGFQVLLTTGTVTSARIMCERLPDGVTHQYAPLDAPRFVRRFLDHWRPDLVLLCESELWPNLLRAIAARGVPLALVNARMSPRSFERWRKAPGVIRTLLSAVDLCLAQSVGDATRLMELGAGRVQIAGNLKYDVPALPADPAETARLKAVLGARPAWLAASTHPGEEKIALAVHEGLRRVFPDLVTIVAPRHAARGPEIAELAGRHGVEALLRSQGRSPGPGAQFYVADTMGELGLFYRLCGLVFVGKSLASGGGQNPIEPAKLGAAILHGPAVDNFIDVYRELGARGGAVEVADAEGLAVALRALLADGRKAREVARAAGESVGAVGGAVDKTMQALEPYILQLRLGRA